MVENINTIAMDAMASCDARSSAILTLQEK